MFGDGAITAIIVDDTSALETRTPRTTEATGFRLDFDLLLVFGRWAEERGRIQQQGMGYETPKLALEKGVCRVRFSDTRIGAGDHNLSRRHFSQLPRLCGRLLCPLFSRQHLGRRIPRPWAAFRQCDGGRQVETLAKVCTLQQGLRTLHAGSMAVKTSVPSCRDASEAKRLQQTFEAD
jgi:hypothetical protein